MKQPLISSELSWLYFNQCIIDEAADHTNALYERIKFLAIFSSNLDEFFRVKVNRLAKEKSVRKSAHFTAILDEIQMQQMEFGNIWRDQIIPELGSNNIVVYEGQAIESFHKREIERYFKSNVLGFIQIVFVKEEANSNYFLDNRRLYFMVKLKDQNGDENHAYITIPSDKLERYKMLSKYEHKDFIISLDEIIKYCMHLLFTQEQIISCYSIKINRDEDYEIEDAK